MFICWIISSVKKATVPETRSLNWLLNFLNKSRYPMRAFSRRMLAELCGRPFTQVVFSIVYRPRCPTIALASTCLLTSSPKWATGQYACGSKRNIESLANYPTTNCTAFGWNNMSKFFFYKILADRFILNLTLWKNSRCHFPTDICVNCRWNRNIRG